MKSFRNNRRTEEQSGYCDVVVDGLVGIGPKGDLKDPMER